MLLMPPNVARTLIKSILAFEGSAMQDIKVDEALWRLVCCQRYRGAMVHRRWSGVAAAI